MKIWFLSLDASSQVMVLGICALTVAVFVVLGVAIGSGEGLDSQWDSSLRLDGGTLGIVDAGGSQ